MMDGHPMMMWGMGLLGLLVVAVLLLSAAALVKYLFLGRPWGGDGGEAPLRRQDGLTTPVVYAGEDRPHAGKLRP